MHTILRYTGNFTLSINPSAGWYMVCFYFIYFSLWLKNYWICNFEVINFFLLLDDIAKSPSRRRNTGRELNNWNGLFSKVNGNEMMMMMMMMLFLCLFDFIFRFIRAIEEAFSPLLATYFLMLMCCLCFAAYATVMVTV